MNKSIPKKLEPDILVKVGESWSLPRIAAWLGTEHGVKTSKTAVQRVVARLTRERGELTKAVVQEKLTKTLTTDLDAVEQMLDRAAKLGTRLSDKNLEPQIAFLEAVLAADITELLDPTTGMLRKLAEIPKHLAAVLHSIENQTGEPLKLKAYDKLRAVELFNRIRREAAEERARLLELRLKLAGAGGGDADAVRERLLAAFAPKEDEKD